MKEYDLFIPLYKKDGIRLSEEWLQQLSKELVDIFGGVTRFPQENEGLWKFGGRVFYDAIMIYRVLSDDEDKARAYLKRLESSLKHELDQMDLLIVSREVELLKW